MSQPNENLNSEVDGSVGRDTRCVLFEQQLDACLDGRDSITALASDPHLSLCSHCRVSFDIYRQFDGTGGAVLNGGARTLPSKRQGPSSGPLRGWLPISAVALAAALIIYAVTSPTGGESNNQFAATGVSSNVTSVNSTAEEVDGFESENDAAAKQWNSNDLVHLRSTVGDSPSQPMLQPLYEVRTISNRFLASNLVTSIVGKPGSGWKKPWQYTSELPGIRPFHRSVNIALVLYNDSMMVL